MPSPGVNEIAVVTVKIRSTCRRVLAGTGQPGVRRSGHVGSDARPTTYFGWATSRRGFALVGMRDLGSMAGSGSTRATRFRRPDLSATKQFVSLMYPCRGRIGYAASHFLVVAELEVVERFIASARSREASPLSLNAWHIVDRIRGKRRAKMVRTGPSSRQDAEDTLLHSSTKTVLEFTAQEGLQPAE